jgi:Cu-processing system permease protein
VTRVLRIARLTFKEAMSRRLIHAGVIASLLFIILFAVAYNFAQERGTQVITGQRSRVLVTVGMASLTLSGLYIVNLLSGFIALFLSVGSISSDVDSGTLHALLARPMRRSQFLLGRWLAYAVIISIYVAVMASLMMLIAASIGSYEVPDPLRAIALMIMAALFLLTLAMLGSTFLPTLTNGAVAFTMLALGWLSGIIETLGNLQENEALFNLGATVALLIPSDALWRSASYFVQSSSIIAATSTVRAALPLLANTAPAPAFVIWGLLYTAILLTTATYVFSRRDL